jgi:hypothetical protein
MCVCVCVCVRACVRVCDYDEAHPCFLVQHLSHLSLAHVRSFGDDFGDADEEEGGGFGDAVDEDVDEEGAGWGNVRALPPPPPPPSPSLPPLPHVLDIGHLISECLSSCASPAPCSWGVRSRQCSPPSPCISTAHTSPTPLA